MSLIRGAVVAGVLCVAAAHMGISSPVPIDAAVGDAYRYPVNGGQNGGTCHGQAGGKYAWVWTPKSSGGCEIYQNCFKDLPPSGELKMSGGAAHNGGLCYLYECTGAVTQPTCVRNVLPDSYDTCTKVAVDNDCTTTGTFKYASLSSGGTTVEDPTITLPETGSFPAGGTATKIRCGTTWGDANGKCGTPCTSDAQCTVAGEKCYADLDDCAGGPSSQPMARSEQPQGSNTGETCVSKQAHVKDTFCQGVGCHEVFGDYCSAATAAGTAEHPDLTYKCVPYASYEGETITDVALHFDVDRAKLVANNKHVTDSFAALTTNTVLELPGDCQRAREQVAGDGNSAPHAIFSSFILALGVAVCV